MRRTVVIALLALGACRTGDPPRVATIPADVGNVDGGPLVTVASPPTEESDEPVGDGEELPAGEGAIGKPAPGFTLDHAVKKGVKVRLLRNRVTVLHFWATWCEPCKRSFVTLDKIHERYADRGVSVIGLSVDDENDRIADFVKRFHARFLVAWDVEHKIANLYKPRMMPTTYVIDRSGIVRAFYDGYNDNQHSELEAEIRALL